MQLKIERRMGSWRDDSALNAIRLICSDGEELKTNNEGVFGDWGAILKSKYGIKKVELRSAPKEYLQKQDQKSIDATGVS